jgi:dolichyl-phosphate beta-glucosyltransferase
MPLYPPRMPEQRVTVVVPAFNEARRLPALLDFLEARGAEVFAAAGLELAKVIVVDDGSTDGTAAVARSRNETGVALRVLELGRNRGKGAAVRAGMLAAAEPLGLLADADMSTPFEEVAKLARALEEGADIAIGSRGLPESDIVVHQPSYRELAGKTFNLGLRLLTGLPYRDTQCGFKLFRLGAARRLFELQRIEGFAYDAEILVLARRDRLRVAEVPVRWLDDPATTVRLVGASSRMARDLLRIGWLARRPARMRRAPADERATAGSPG